MTVQTDDELATLNGLIRKIQAFKPERDVLNAYYEGARRLQALGLSLPPEMDDLQVVINWPGMWVEALEERLDIEGFRLDGRDLADERLAEWWAANNLLEESGLAHLESFITRAAYATVGFPDDRGDPPVITPESSASMAADVDHRTRRVRSAARLYDDDRRGRPQSAALYLPDANVYYQRSGRGWVEYDRVNHNLGRTLVQPLINRARLGDRTGATEMRDVMGLSDAACRSITNLQGAQELLAVPQRYVTGASEKDFIDSKTGELVPAWEAYLGRLQALMNENAKVFQLSGADLRNFTETINFYARLVSGLTGLPAHYLGFTSDNPASADAIRSGENRFIKHAERKCRSLGGDWVNVNRLALLVAGDEKAAAARQEAIWRDPGTPTYQAKAASVTQLVSVGIIPVEAAWEDLGYSIERQNRLRALMARNDPAARYLAMLNSGGGQTGGQGDGGEAGDGGREPGTAGAAA